MLISGGHAEEAGGTVKIQGGRGRVGGEAHLVGGLSENEKGGDVSEWQPRQPQTYLASLFPALTPFLRNQIGLQPHVQVGLCLHGKCGDRDQVVGLCECWGMFFCLGYGVLRLNKFALFASSIIVSTKGTFDSAGPVYQTAFLYHGTDLTTLVPTLQNTKTLVREASNSGRGRCSSPMHNRARSQSRRAIPTRDPAERCRSSRDLPGVPATFKLRAAPTPATGPATFSSTPVEATSTPSLATRALYR